MKTGAQKFLIGVLLLAASLRPADGADDLGKFLGAASCGSSGCHGGAGDKSNQFLVWSQRDFHSRSYATLTSARSERFAETLKLENAATSERCAACHAPFHTVPKDGRLEGAVATQGVS